MLLDCSRCLSRFHHSIVNSRNCYPEGPIVGGACPTERSIGFEDGSIHGGSEQPPTQEDRLGFESTIPMTRLAVTDQTPEVGSAELSSGSSEVSSSAVSLGL